MSTDLTEAHEELRAVARALLAKAPLGKSGTSPSWKLLADSGWLGLEVGAGLGGGEATFAEVAVLLQELGRAAASSPYLGTAVLGVGALRAVAPTPAVDELLGQVAAGEQLICVALATGDEVVDGDVAPFRIERVAGRLRLRGQAAFIPDAVGADRLLLLARDLDALPVVVSAVAGQVGVESQEVLDGSRRLAVVTADGVDIEEASIWRLAGDPEAACRVLADRAALAVACDSLGLSEAMLDATVSYAGQREQFGRPIGSFQAVKHACADMLVRISIARELVGEAARALGNGDDVASPATVSTAVSMAKSYAGSAAVDIAGKAMQLHGGIGYTWESGVHAYLKRATLNRSLFGSPTAHRRRLARRYDG